MRRPASIQATPRRWHVSSGKQCSLWKRTLLSSKVSRLPSNFCVLVKTPISFSIKAELVEFDQQKQSAGIRILMIIDEVQKILRLLSR